MSFNMPTDDEEEALWLERQQQVHKKTRGKPYKQYSVKYVPKRPPEWHQTCAIPFQK